MNTTLIALQNLYVALGGALTDTYDDIFDGETVGNYAIIPDIINAIAELGAIKASSALGINNSNNLTITTESGLEIEAQDIYLTSTDGDLELRAEKNGAQVLIQTTESGSISLETGTATVNSNEIATTE